jgi:hypothetical protein
MWSVAFKSTGFVAFYARQKFNGAWTCRRKSGLLRPGPATRLSQSCLNKEPPGIALAALLGSLSNWSRWPFLARAAPRPIVNLEQQPSGLQWVKAQ